MSGRGRCPNSNKAMMRRRYCRWPALVAAAALVACCSLSYAAGQNSSEDDAVGPAPQVAAPLVQGQKFECSGMGRRYCGNAHVVSSCPLPCRPERCSKVKLDSTAIGRAGVDDFREWNWIDLIKGGHYDNVYVYGDEVCVASCWYKPWESQCVRSRQNRFGEKYCSQLTCTHDQGFGPNKGDRYSGCHKDLVTGEQKKPWHQPTCEECLVLFQKACYWPLQGYVDSSAEEDSSEVAARDSSQWDSRGEDWLPTTSDSSSAANPERVSDGSSETIEADASSDGSQNNTNPLSEKNATSEESEFRTKKPPRKEWWSRPEPSSEGSIGAKPTGRWVKGHWTNYGRWIPGRWVQGSLSAQGDLVGPNGVNNDALESAPERWQALFMDEYSDRDTSVAAVTNVILQLDDTSDNLDDELLTETIAEAAGVDPMQVMVLHKVEVDDLMMYETATNGTSDLLTVSVGIVSEDPRDLIEKTEAFNDESLQFMLKERANVTYLEGSMSASLKRVSERMIRPEALPHAMLMTREMAMQSDDPEAPAKSIMIIIIAAACAISLAVLVMGAVVAIKYTRRQAAHAADEPPPEAYAGDNLKPLKTKVPGGIDAADIDGCTSPAVAAQHAANVI